MGDADGHAAALVTAVLAGDEEAFVGLVDELPALPIMLDAAAGLLRDAALAAVAVTFCRPADDDDVAAAWDNAAPGLSATLACYHGFSGSAVGEWTDWAGRALTTGEYHIPVCDQSACLAVVLAMIAEMFRAHPRREWPRFLADRAARVPVGVVQSADSRAAVT
jgi:hypothetical protein